MKRFLLAVLLTSLTNLNAQEFGVNDLKISDMGTDGVTSFYAFDPQVAYSVTENKYLVVWTADDDTGSLVDNEFEVYGQFINNLGEEVQTNDFRISFTGTDGDTRFRADEPDVTWNSVNNEFLVVWKGETAVDGELEIYGQRIDANSGALIGSNFRISDVGDEGNTILGAAKPKVSYSSTSNEYLVVWEGDDENQNNEMEIYGQRLSNTGAEIGSNDFKISNQLPEGDANFDARYPHLSWNSIDNEFLIIWQGETATNEEAEVFGQLYDANTNSLLGSNFKISDMGTDGDTSFSIGQFVRCAYNAIDQEYLVIWNGSDIGANLYEIYGQRLTSSGSEVGTNDFRITIVTDTNSNFDAWAPAITWNEKNNEYFLVYRADANNTQNEEEIYGQIITNTGSNSGGTFLLSDMGTDGDANYDADNPAVATNGQDAYLIVWQGDDNIAPNDGETEIYLQMYGDASLSITETSLKEASVFPNPTSSVFTIKTGHDSQLTKLEIYNIKGQKILTKKSGITETNISGFESGIYFVKLYSQTKMETIKLIKK
ncbi:T9SS type A sorting domain-containing protein [Pontimicrobium aquaticum]|uniref:T9SS type A sorting domain-containing protein n=1 Tax=Pontimicrobium aquaticum TaxID=2565367 RepID=A0A4U0F0B4_9FLAO|nr:T9SS type A sorting domain-containing protein [Pontimicrobium aquaticum]TJY37783.1 T9SS type A sorting domain-containing protein [Pontimicrobium aquaticum]